MALEQGLVTRSFKAGADLSSGQYRFVKMDASGDVVLCDTDGERAVGVVQNDPESGRAATVAVGGRSKVEAGAAIAIGDLVTVGTDGRGLTADGTSATDEVVLGIARSAADAAGEIVSVELSVPHVGQA